MTVLKPIIWINTEVKKLGLGLHLDAYNYYLNSY